MTLEPKHNQAIREEIGDRLRLYLAHEQSARPSTRLRKLLGRLEKLEGRATARGTPHGWRSTDSLPSA